MKIGIAVLGAGRWGVNLIRNFLEHPDSEILAVIDPHPERLAAVQKQFDLNSEVILAADRSQVQGLPGLTAVAIATPASTHYTLAAAALKAGYHVLVEKPLALKLAEAIELCELADKQQRQLFVDHTYLFHPAIAKGQTIIQQNQLGNLRYGYAQRTHFEPVRHDVDALWDLAVHDIAIFNTWLQQMPIQVTATGKVFPKTEILQDAPQDSVCSIEPLAELADLVWVTLTYPSGFQAFIHLCWLNPDRQRRLTVVGSSGTLIFDEMQSKNPLILQRGKLHSRSPDNLFAGAIAPPKTNFYHREVLSLEPVEPLRQACDRFLKCVRTNTPCPVSSGTASVELIRILCTLSRSLQQGGKSLTIM
ncbi:MAG: Gfo/Idh/MocA family oxidoreductase [Oscillatoriales cyanobacterium RU_3_3]|nr:Gfo/Idh/MocA family oxidoreductase [Oscillatoriales cyanobacterium RU_3_3]